MLLRLFVPIWLIAFFVACSTVDVFDDSIWRIEKVILPQLAVANSSERPWSPNSTIFARSRLEVRYDNFTIAHDAASPGQRWTTVSRRSVPHKLKRRGFGIYKAQYPDWLWSYTIAPAHGYVYIRLCYENEQAFNKLGCLMPAAVQRWNSRLYQRAGVYFDLRNELCPRAYPGGPIQSNADFVTIMYRQGIAGVSTLGRQAASIHGEPRFYIKMDPDLPAFRDPRKADATDTLTHELGHTLGLVHEHQRYDARSYIDFTISDVPGYDEVVNQVTTYNYRWPEGWQRSGRITPSDVVQYAELSLSIPQLAASWDGGSFLPYSIDAQGLSIRGRLAAYTYYGPFDPSSIMLYPTEPPPNGPRLRLRGGGPIPVNRVPSSRDINAVAAMYPYPAPAVVPAR